MKHEFDWDKFFNWLVVICIIITIIIFFYVSFFVSKKTICVETIGMKNISIDKADLREANDFLKDCTYYCRNGFSHNNDRLECVKLCFSMVQIK